MCMYTQCQGNKLQRNFETLKDILICLLEILCLLGPSFNPVSNFPVSLLSITQVCTFHFLF